MKAAVIGLGRVGAQWEWRDKFRRKPATHCGAWLSTEGVELKAACDLNRDTLFESHKIINTTPENMFPGSRARGVKAYSDYQNMLRDEEYDIVSVATPAITHKEIVWHIAAHKLAKLIFCEKPLATTVEDAQHMIDTCHENGVKLAVDCTRRWDPVYRRVAKVLKSKKYGRVVGAQSAFSGSLLEVGIHLADLYEWYNLSGTPLMLDVNYLVFELTIFCEEGKIVLPRPDFNAYGMKVGQSPAYDGVLETLPDETIKPDEETAMLHATRQLRDCVLKNEEPFCTGRDGRLSLERVMSWMK